MSYSRCNGVSEIYLYGTLEALECTVAFKVAQQAMVLQHYIVKYTEPGEAQKAMLGHLYYLKDNGVNVPGYAIRRLIEEISEAEDDKYLTQLAKEDERETSAKSNNPQGTTGVRQDI